MSHVEQLAFFRACVEANASEVAGSRVLEIGSYDVNGSVRALFPEAERYVGVDLIDGPGVDVVAFGHELDFPEGSFDIVISGECFEHDRHWRETFASMVRIVKPGGLVIVTCASRGRVEHGTTRSGSTQSPGTEHLGSDYYQNVSKASLDNLPTIGLLSGHRTWYLPRSADLYFAGIKKGGSSSFTLPEPGCVDRIAGLMRLPERGMRAPLRAAARLPISESTFQAFAIPYWRNVCRLTQLTGRLRERRLREAPAR